MKAKITLPRTCVFLAVLLLAVNTKAQQPLAKPVSQMPAHVSKNSSFANYTYRVFQAPNKMFGYDIMLNGKLVFHQFASLAQPANAVFVKNQNPYPGNNKNIAISKKEHAEKAAMFAIEKIKRKESPTLSPDEIKKISVL